MTIAVFANRVRQGGHGFVVALSGAGIERATGWRPAQPLNGQRCLTRAAFEAARPLAPGFGVETALTIDLLRRGMRVREVEVPLAHRATGTDWRAQIHRARQFADVARALAVRQVAGRGPAIRGRGPNGGMRGPNGGMREPNGGCRSPAAGRGSPAAGSQSPAADEPRRRGHRTPGTRGTAADGPRRREPEPPGPPGAPRHRAGGRKALRRRRERRRAGGPGPHRPVHRRHHRYRAGRAVRDGAGPAWAAGPATLGPRPPAAARRRDRPGRRRAGGRNGRPWPVPARPPARLDGVSPEGPGGRLHRGGGDHAGAPVRLLGSAVLRRLRPDGAHRARPLPHHPRHARPPRRSGGAGGAGLAGQPLGLRRPRHRRPGAGVVDRRGLGPAHGLRAVPAGAGRVRRDRPAAAPAHPREPATPAARRAAVGAEPPAPAGAGGRRARRQPGDRVRGRRYSGLRPRPA